MMVILHANMILLTLSIYPDAVAIFFIVMISELSVPETHLDRHI